MTKKARDRRVYVYIHARSLVVRIRRRRSEMLSGFLFFVRVFITFLFARFCAYLSGE